MEEKCIFCEIAAKRLPTNAVYEDEQVIAFLDIRPSNPGHTLVVPKKHYETLLDVPEEEAAHLMKVVKHIAEGIVESMKADGFNILQNNKKAAYQLIPHAHFHVVPRFENDNLPLGNIRQGSYKDEQEMKDVATKIRANVKSVKEKEASEKFEVKEKNEKENKPRSRRLKKDEAFLIRREIEMA
jgi:histidine triad (HIT) family protein